MKMEGHFHYSSLPPLYPLRFLFPLFTIFMSCLAPPSRASRACSKPFKCGNLTLEYPFGRKNSDCGDPALQLDCDHQVNMTLINISGYQYYILELWEDDYMMRIIDKNLWGQRCNPLFSNHTIEIWSSLRFSFAEGYRNLTLWEACPSTTKDIRSLPCNHNWYLNLTEGLNLSGICESQVILPVLAESLQFPLTLLSSIQEGFRIKWDPNKNCSYCDSHGGYCAYNKTNSTQIYCKWPKKKPPVKTIILGGVIGTAALLMTGVVLMFVSRKTWLSASSEKPDLSNVEKFLQDYVHQMPSRYSYSQLMKITNKFAHRVGEGGFGVVYKGKLAAGDLVAVKMLDQSRCCENQFMNEVATIGRIRHVHLVRLMGYCYEEHRNAVVYEYMANGSLDEFIFVGREKEAILNWAQLYSIALGAACGIAYLHQDCDNRIIHFDIKPHNILLDEEFTPKIADFGLAKLCGKKDDHISMTAARGTPAYAVPEVWSRNLGAVTDKSDVYIFGMVLLEMVGGRKNVDVQVSQSSQFYFLEWAFKLMEDAQLERGLRGSGTAKIECEEKEKAIRLARVGLWCI